MKGPRVETPCTEAGQHRLGAVIEVLPNGRVIRPCDSGCEETYEVEPETTRIYADALPLGVRS